MAKKMLVSLAMEGKFSGEGLHSFEDDDDILTAMARELVTKQGIGESADAVWRHLQTEQSRFLPPALAVPDHPGSDTVLSRLPPPSALNIPSVACAVEFGVQPPPSPDRRREGADPV
jgi:hypothetical protein